MNDFATPNGSSGGRTGPDQLGTADELRNELAAIVASSDDAIIGQSLDGLITSWNPGAEHVFGYIAEEIIGLPVAVLAWPGHEEDVDSVLARVRRGERVDHYETLRRSKDGRPVTVSLTVSPIRNAEGVVVGISKVARDITAVRDSERTRALLSAIVESSDDGIISKDLNGIVTSWNSGAEHIFGYTAEEMIGQPISRIACPGREDDLVQILNRIRVGERVHHYETGRRCKDGREVAISLTVSPIRDGTGRIIGASKIARDVTLQKQAEATLRETEKLAITGRMAASIAHEINNPLEGLTNLLYLLDKEELSHQARQYLSSAQQELARVTYITAQTLGFHRNAAHLNTSIVDELMESALALNQGRFISTGVVLRKQYAPIPSLSCNPVELRQIFMNLVVNALDAMLKGGVLRVKVRPATRWSTGARGVRITVADTGSGMSPETRRHLFEPFYTTKSSTGTGLGLWVSSEIIEKYNGCISVRSSSHPAQHGSTFIVFLPRPA